MPQRTLAAAAVATGLLVAAAPASAAGWKRVTATNGSPIDQVAIARTLDGTLHVAWAHPTGSLSEDLLHTAITPSGRIGATTAIQTGWTGFEDPALVDTPTGLRAFWGGIRTTAPGETNTELNTAVSLDAGATWALQTGSIVPLGAQPYGSSVSAAVLPDGTTLQTWAGTLGTWVHAGLDPLAPNHDLQGPLGQYGYDPGIATDADGRTVVAWYSSARGHRGVLAEDVGPDGLGSGAVQTMPGTSSMTSGTLARTPIVARPGGGFFVAYTTGYPTQNRVRLWRVDTRSAPVVARANGTGNKPATVAAAPDGRVWVVWAANSTSGPVVYARRSNRDATRLGATVVAGRVAGANGASALDASVAPDEGLDVLAVFGIGTSPDAATYHRRIRPGLTLTARPARIRRAVTKDVRFKVTDAGDPVRGARVHVGAIAGTTDSRGRVTLTLRTLRERLTAKASLEGYVGASVRIVTRG